MVNTYEHDLSNYNKVSVTIQYGDTAWNIQQKLTPNEDVRNILELDNYINGKDVGDLKPGDVVTFLQPKAGN